MKKITSAAIAGLSLLFTACNNEGDIQPQSKNYLTFESVEEFNSALEKVSSMTHAERVAWEAQNNYSSIGTASDEFYKSIDPEQFKSYEEIIEFVSQHSQYLELSTDENGEVSVDAKEENDIERYLMNDDKMYQIGSNFYKKIDEQLVFTDEKNYLKLKSASSIKELSSIERGFSVEKVITASQNSHAAAVPKSADGRMNAAQKESWDQDGNVRQQLWIQTKNVQKDGVRHRRHEYLVKNQKKTLGVWFLAPRTTYFEIHMEVCDDNSAIFDCSAYNAYLNGANIDKDSDSSHKYLGNYYQSEPYFSVINCWSRNASGCYNSIKNY